MGCWRIITIAWAGWMLAASHLPAAAKPATGSRWALLVGVDEYAEVEPLSYCGADVRALRSQLVANGFPAKQVISLDDQAAESKYRPLRANIERQLDLVLGLVEPGDLVLVAFSGHGVHLDGKSYLCPTETRLGDPGTLISLDGVYGRLARCRASLKLLVVDACRNDPRPRGVRGLAAPANARQFAASLQRPPQGILLLSSCAPGQTSREDADLGHGVFMHYLLGGLKGPADSDRNGGVSLIELYQYANRETKAHVARKFNVLQTPALHGELDDNFDLVSAVAARGSRWRNSIDMEFVRVGRGEFWMGSAEGEGYDNERPRHRVTIGEDFYLGATEVTQGHYLKVMGENPSHFGPKGASSGKGAGPWETLPVENVSWDDAREFCRRLARLEGCGDDFYRLPSEAQWEYAARAGETRGTDLELQAWYAANSQGRTHCVATRQANAWGLHDMLGNVAEWCEDWFDADYYARSAAADPRGPASAPSDGYRVTRGGSWNDSPTYCRPADRNAVRPATRENCFGFRVIAAGP